MFFPFASLAAAAKDTGAEEAGEEAKCFDNSLYYNTIFFIYFIIYFVIIDSISHALRRYI